MLDRNPLVVGKIIQYAQGDEGQVEFFKSLRNLENHSVEAFALITEWIVVTSGSLSHLEYEILNDSSFWGKLEENYESGDAQLRYNLLKIIRMISIINLDIILSNSFISHNLNIEILEILVKEHGKTQVAKVIDFMTSRKIMQLLFESDDDKIRFRILRNLTYLLEMLPPECSIIAELLDYVKNGEDGRILQILIFLLKKINIFSQEDFVRKRIFDVITKSCESEDQSMRKNAFYVLKNYLLVEKDSMHVDEEVSNCYIAILNAVEQNQSHLICPAINMLPKIEKMELDWQILLIRCILRTQNRSIICPTINYITKRKDFDVVIDNVLALAFAALNQITIHKEEPDVPQKFCRRAFMWNWRMSIGKLAEIQWLPFPLFSIFTFIADLQTSTHSFENVAK